MTFFADICCWLSWLWCTTAELGVIFGLQTQGWQQLHKNLTNAGEGCSTIVLCAGCPPPSFAGISRFWAFGTMREPVLTAELLARASDSSGAANGKLEMLPPCPRVPGEQLLSRTATYLMALGRRCCECVQLNPSLGWALTFPDPAGRGGRDPSSELCLCRGVFAQVCKGSASFPAPIPSYSRCRISFVELWFPLCMGCHNPEALLGGGGHCRGLCCSNKAGITSCMCITSHLSPLVLFGISCSEHCKGSVFQRMLFFTWTTGYH